MDNEKIETKYFLNNFPQPTKDLFYSDPKKFKTLYKTKLAKIVKQDLLQMIQFVTPVYEITYYTDWYDSWHEENFWYYIKSDVKQEAKKLFDIYCTSQARNIGNGTSFEVRNKEFFNLLRIIYYYVNYKNKEKWEMSGVRPLNVSNSYDIRPTIYTGDFIKDDFNLKTKKSSLKMKKKKSELGKQIEQECLKITDRLIDAEIRRISDINKQIQNAKATLAKYGTELVRGY